MKKRSGHEWKRRDLLDVEWEDHSVTGRWRDERDAKEVAERRMLCRSVGWKLHETKEQLTLIQSQSSNDDISDMVHILKAAIVSRRKVR